MNQYLREMIELSKIDNAITEFEPKIEKVRKEYETIANRRVAIAEAIEKLESSKNRNLEKIAESEKRLKELQEEEKIYLEKLKTAKTERELENLNVEKQTRDNLFNSHHESIAELNREIEHIEEQLAKKEQELQEFQKEFGEYERDLVLKLEELKNQQKELSQERNQLVSQMDSKIFSFYQRIRRWAKETTAVPVRDQACYGCFMKLSNQVYLEVIKGEEIVTCPNCGRLVYLESHLEEE